MIRRQLTRTLPRKANLSGFTLVELVIVLVIIGILAAVGTYMYTEYRKDAINSQLVSEAKLLRTTTIAACARYRSAGSTVMSFAVTAGALASPTAQGYLDTQPNSSVFTIVAPSCDLTTTSGYINNPVYPCTAAGVPLAACVAIGANFGVQI